MPRKKKPWKHSKNEPINRAWKEQLETEHRDEIKKLKEEFDRKNDLIFLQTFLFRTGNFPPGVLLSGVHYRPDGGVANMVISSDEMRRFAHLLTTKFNGWDKSQKSFVGKPESQETNDGKPP